MDLVLLSSPEVHLLPRDREKRATTITRRKTARSAVGGGRVATAEGLGPTGKYLQGSGAYFRGRFGREGVEMGGERESERFFFIKKTRPLFLFFLSRFLFSQGSHVFFIGRQVFLFDTCTTKYLYTTSLFLFYFSTKKIVTLEAMIWLFF